MTKINPLEQLIAIYGQKFHEALKAGDVTKAIRMCADYQNPDTGKWLDYGRRIRAFAYRVSLEAFKIPEIPSDAITIKFTPEAFHRLQSDSEFRYEDAMFRSMDGKFKLYGVTMQRVYE